MTTCPQARTSSWTAVPGEPRPQSTVAHAQVRRPSTSAEALDEPGNGFDPRRNRHLAAARYAVLVAAAYVLFAWIAPASVHAESIVVGQTLSLTGPSPRVAQDLLRGRQACADWINAQGGIRGQSLKIVTRDDRNDPALAVKQAQELVDREGAVAFFGSMGPSVNAAVLDWANAQGMAVLGPYGGDIENRTRRYDTAYFLTANQSAEAERLALHVASLGMNRVVIVHSSDPAGRAALTALEEGLGGTNVAAIALIAAKPDGSDAATVAQSVSKAKAQAVLLATSGRATIALLQSLTAASSSGLNLLQIYGLSSAASQAELIELGARARGFAMSQVVPLPRDTRIPVVLAFHSAMRGIPGERTYAELEGCMASLLLGEVLRRKPVTSNRAAILQAMRSTGRVNLGGFEIDLNDRTRPGSQYTDIVYIGFEGKITR